MPEISRHRRRFVAGLFVVLALGIVFFALRNLGAWLEIDETLHRANAIVVLGGGLPFRAMEAARLYRVGWAGEVWLTHESPNTGDRALEQIGVEVTHEYQYSQRVLEKLGVPAAAIRLVPEGVNNTVAEVRAIVRYARATLPAERETGPLILVTSPYHTRRVRVIWNTAARGAAAAIVRAAPLEPYDPQRWWHTTTDAFATFKELFGILNAWAGFPIDPREH